MGGVGIGLTMESRLEQELPAAVLSLPLTGPLMQPPYNVYGLIFDTMHSAHTGPRVLHWCDTRLATC